jgi:broad specificity polyphosphatase/5'/3'-nucleotidase SurE
MDHFKAGFQKYATECGVPESQALHLWKRALDYPGTEEVFKNLNIPTVPQQEQSPEELETLAKLMEQEKVNQELQQMKQQLGI